MKLTEEKSEIEMLRQIAADRRTKITNHGRVANLMTRGWVVWQATGPDIGWFITPAGRSALQREGE